MSDALLADILSELRRQTSLIEAQAHQGVSPLRTPAEAAPLLGVHVKTLIARIQDGTWPGHRAGRFYKVDVAAVQAAMRVQTRGNGHVAQ